MEKENYRQLEKKAGVLIIIFGFVVLIIGWIFVVPNIEFIENIVGEFWTVVLIAFMIACLSLIPMHVFIYVEDKRKNIQS